MSANLKYVDREGRVFWMKDADRQSAVQVHSSWFGGQKRVCYKLGFRLFLAKTDSLDPYDAINLFQSGIKITYIPGAALKDYCLIEGCSNGCVSRQYKMTFLNSSTEIWCKHLQETVLMESLSRTKDVEPSFYSYKYLMVSLVLEWLFLRDFVRLDSSLCNSNQRRMFLSLLDEYSQQFSNKFLPSRLSIKVRTVNWLLQRNITAGCVEFRNTSLLNALMERELYSFSSITELLYESDSSLFYSLLVRCPNLKLLLIYFVSDKSKFVSTVIVHNRQLQSLWFNTIKFTDRDYLRLALHHLNFSSSCLVTSEMLPFRASLWYQKPPESLTLHSAFKNEHIMEICKRTQSIHSLFDSNSDTIIVKVLETQLQLKTVNIVMSYSPYVSMPSSLARCNSIKHLTLTRRGNVKPLDWSCLRTSSLRLTSLHVAMPNENFLAHAIDVLREATSLSVDNNVVTIDEMLLILKANESRLTTLEVYRAERLEGVFLRDAAMHGGSLQTLRIPWNADKTRIEDLQTFAVCGSKTLRCLCIPSKLISEEAVLLLAGNFPALRYLMLECSHYTLSLKIVQFILDAIGVQLIDLGLEYCGADFKANARAMAQLIDHYCEVV